CPLARDCSRCFVASPLGERKPIAARHRAGAGAEIEDVAGERDPIEERGQKRLPVGGVVMRGASEVHCPAQRARRSVKFLSRAGMASTSRNPASFKSGVSSATVLWPRARPTIASK